MAEDQMVSLSEYASIKIISLLLHLQYSRKSISFTLNAKL